MERELARTERRVRKVVAWMAERSRQQEARRDEAAGQRMVCARLRDELAMMREYKRLRTQVSTVQYSTVQCSTVQYSTGDCVPRSRTAGGWLLRPRDRGCSGRGCGASGPGGRRSGTR